MQTKVPCDGGVFKYQTAFFSMCAHYLQSVIKNSLIRGNLFIVIKFYFITFNISSFEIQPNRNSSIMYTGMQTAHKSIM